MGFLKRIVEAFTGGGGSSSSEDHGGEYVYIKIRRTGEIVQLRINKGNEISQDDDGQLFVRKLVMGQRSFERIEATIYFDSSYRVKDADLPGGELSDRDAYLAQQAQIAG
jgi:hypothetical protein